MNKYEFAERVEAIIHLLIECEVITTIKGNNYEVKITNCEIFEELNYLTFRFEVENYNNRELTLVSQHIINNIITFIDKNVSSCYNCYIKEGNRNESN